jgi:DNA primase
VSTQGSAHAPSRDGTHAEALKLAHPIEEVVASYGIELRRQGQALVGRCPLHHDQGRPNLHVWPASSSWCCFRCSVGGDAIRWIELVEQVDFRRAVERLRAGVHGAPRSLATPTGQSPPRRPVDDRDPLEAAVLQAATTLYHQRLQTDPAAMAYVLGRGIDRATVEACRVGYAAGDELVPYLAWRRLGLEPALRVGLLDRNGREFLAGRIVVPDVRNHRPEWLVGRLLESDTGADDAADSPPRYLGLPGSKPLLGLQQVDASPSVIATEGVFDWLTLRRWGYPAVALVGTHARLDIVERLRGFQRVYLALDQDDAGLEATLRLLDVLGPAAIPVALPDGIKDVAELAPRPDGHAVFARALLEGAGTAPCETGAADRMSVS